MLGHPLDVKSVVLDTLLPSINANTVKIDHTSRHPALAGKTFHFALEKQCYSVDASLSGGDIGARDGKLAIFAGGNPDVVKWLMPLFDVLGKATYMGAPGTGQSCKIANQITVGGNMVGLSEGLVFAEKAGLDIRGRGAEDGVLTQLFCCRFCLILASMAVRGAGDRGGFGRGFEGRGGRGARGGRGGGRRDSARKSGLHRSSKKARPPCSGRIKSIEQTCLHSLPIKEYHLLIGPSLKDEVMKIMPVQKQTRAGQRTPFNAFVVVDLLEMEMDIVYVGIAVKCSK